MKTCNLCAVPSTEYCYLQLHSLAMLPAITACSHNPLSHCLVPSFSSPRNLPKDHSIHNSTWLHCERDREEMSSPETNSSMNYSDANLYSKTFLCMLGEKNVNDWEYIFIHVNLSIWKKSTLTNLQTNLNVRSKLQQWWPANQFIHPRQTHSQKMLIFIFLFSYLTLQILKHFGLDL